MEGRDRAERVLRAIIRRLPFVKEETASRFVHQLADRLHDLARQPELIRRGVLWATANWLLDAAALWVFLRAFGESVNPVNLIVAYGVAGVLAAIPITPGGLGVVETALPALLVGFGVAAGHRRPRRAGLALRPVLAPIPLGGLSYASLKLGPLGREAPPGAVRDLARRPARPPTARLGRGDRRVPGREADDRRSRHAWSWPTDAPVTEELDRQRPVERREPPTEHPDDGPTRSTSRRRDRGGEARWVAGGGRARRVRKRSSTWLRASWVGWPGSSHQVVGEHRVGVARMPWALPFEESIRRDEGIAELLAQAGEPLRPGDSAVAGEAQAEHAQVALVAQRVLDRRQVGRRAG